jgi:TatA/E family protein of Tat protein translocase
MTQLPLFLPHLGVPEIVLIGFIFALMFGGSKLPKLGKGIGGFFRNLKQGVEFDGDDDEEV